MQGSPFNLRLSRLTLVLTVLAAAALLITGILTWGSNDPGIAFLFTGALVAAFIPLRVIQYRRASIAHKGLCPHCRYQVRDGDLLQCPECGRAVRRTY